MTLDHSQINADAVSCWPNYFWKITCIESIKEQHCLIIYENRLGAVCENTTASIESPLQLSLYKKRHKYFFWIVFVAFFVIIMPLNYSNHT